MKKRLTGLSLGLLALGSALTGCQNIAVHAPPAAPPVEVRLPAPPVEVDLIGMSHQIADALVAELRKNHPSYHRSKPILVTSFVHRSNLDSTSELGLLLSDHIASRITQQGFAVLEPKLRQDLAIRMQQGEFILSRDIEKLSAEYKAYAVVTGNYTRGRTNLDFTTRMIRVNNRQVLASVDAKLPLNPNTEDLLLETGGPSLSVVDR
ncbi:FlgO family outer membrane protein [Magnetococcus sp. PR-3]|uniref:FlgO family outer membrane protein n=1 Tax=Magnetococcus sp. PR-3 TaxID=3120355 RepID=UPI002FCE4C9F